jgi:hypothetical protein
MATTNKIFIQEGDQVIELTGKDKEVFVAQRALDQKQSDASLNKAQEQKELKVSAYTKLGLTEEEINAIL